MIGYVPEFEGGSDLFDNIATQAAERRAEFNAQGISNMVWAYAKVDKPHALLFEAMEDQVVASGVSHPKLFEKVANCIVRLDSLYGFKPQELSNTMWAYATAQVPHPKLFQKVAKAAIQCKGEFNSQNVANLLWAYATMGIGDKKLFSSFVLTATKLLGSYENQGHANIAWAYAVANVDAPALFNDHFINKCIEKEGGFEKKALRQLHQWHLWQTKEKSVNTGLPKELANRCYNKFISKDPKVSKLQENVVARLSSIGLEPKEEVLMDSGYRIDAM